MRGGIKCTMDRYNYLRDRLCGIFDISCAAGNMDNTAGERYCGGLLFYKPACRLWEYNHRQEESRYSKKFRYIYNTAVERIMQRMCVYIRSSGLITDVYNAASAAYRGFVNKKERGYILAGVAETALRLYETARHMLSDSCCNRRKMSIARFCCAFPRWAASRSGSRGCWTDSCRCRAKALI